MSYSKGFVLSTKLNKSNTFLKEIRKNNEPTVYMPFGSEYSIFLKNKTAHKAKFTIKLDGKYVHPEDDSFISNPNSSFDLERFLLDGDMHKGDKLKFVNVEGSGEEPGADENGLIEVKIELEKVSKYLSDDILCFGDHIRKANIFNSRLNCESESFGCDTISFCSTSESATMDWMENSLERSEEGVTTGGSESNQSFINVLDFETEGDPIILKLRIKPVKNSASKDTVCIGCDGNKKQRNNDGIWILCPICNGTGIWNG